MLGLLAPGTVTQGEGVQGDPGLEMVAQGIGCGGPTEQLRDTMIASSRRLDESDELLQYVSVDQPAHARVPPFREQRRTRSFR
jgi:hypothetical protein